jgi:protein O-GlcNAc transferase
MKLKIEQALELGISAHKEGKFLDAERYYKFILESQPNHPDANHNLGLLAISFYKVETALTLFKIALETNPKVDQFWISYIQTFIKENYFKEAHENIEKAKLNEIDGILIDKLSLQLETKSKNPTPPESQLNILLNHYHNNKYFEAEKIAHNIIQNFPNHPLSYKVIAAVLNYNGKLSEGIIISQKSLKIFPKDPEIHNNLGVMLQKIGKIEEAELSFREAISLKSNYAEAYGNLGNAIIELGKLEEAEILCRKAISIKSDYAEGHNNLGITLQRMFKLEQAADSYKKAISLKPDYAEAYSNLGNTMGLLGKIEEAEIICKKAITLKKDFPDFHNNLGNILKMQNKLKEAEQSYIQAISLKSDYAEAHSNLGNIMKDQGKLVEAEFYCKQAINLKSHLPEAHNNLGTTLQKMGNLEEALKHYRKGISLKPDFSECHSNKNLCLNYFQGISNQYIFEQHLEFGKQFDKLRKILNLNFSNKKYSKKNLRVGYVSGDFREGSIAYFFEMLLLHHDPKKVKTFCYYNDFILDETTTRLKELSTHWRSIFNLSDNDVIKIIRNDEIDILVDLSGHTAKNRLLVFAYKPAPIQITWLGYPNTTGLSAIDYRFTDIISDPIGKSEKFYSEKLYRLDNNFLCYKGDQTISFNNIPPNKSSNYITFGSFNNFSKITSNVIKTWSVILKNIPKSRLILKSPQLNKNVKFYLDIFEKEGVNRDRIEFIERIDSSSDHLQLYNKIDISLDTFPYNGTTTTFESLWMGVPVITLRGNSHVSRVGASILTNLEFTDFIADDIKSYINLASDIISNLDKLEIIRQNLRKKMQNSQLCDGSLFAQNVEHAYQKMWSKFLN